MRISLPKNSALAVAAVAALALSLTACNGDDKASSSASADTSASSSASGDSDQSASPTAGSGSGSGGSSAASGSNSGSSPGSGKGSGSGSGSGKGVTSDPECALGTMSLSLSEGGSAYTEMLKATNTGASECTLTAAPTVTYPSASAALPTAGKAPQYPIRLRPGASAYAAIGLATQENAASHREKQLFIAQIGQDGHSTLNVPGPAGLLLGDNSSVTYWWDNSAKAMTDGEG